MTADGNAIAQHVQTYIIHQQVLTTELVGNYKGGQIQRQLTATQAGIAAVQASITDMQASITDMQASITAMQASMASSTDLNAAQ